MQHATRGLAAAVLTIGLSACVPAGAPGPGCDAAGYAGLIGTNIAAVTLPAEANIRVIGPDTMVTMEFNETRTNIAVDREGIIVRVYCG